MVPPVIWIRFIVRTFLLAVLFLGFVVVLTTLAVMLVVPGISGLVAVFPDEPASARQTLATIVPAVSLVFTTLYAGGLVWLFLVCHLFKRDEIEQFMNAGPNTRFEVWLLERFSR